ncbi:hypothetical protein [Ligilactobacillus sp.]|uniref:hypothetical protein n=1 Tax=Ligilactobacillus sp. TaxID=2767921 RepID=UPI002FDFB8FC
MKKATDCGLAAIVLMMLFSLVLTAKDAFLATGSRGRDAALFLCLEIILGIVIVCLPKIISVKFDLYLPPMIYGFFLLFIFGAIYLGTIYHFYRIPYWDKGLHLISGALLASFALAIFGALVPQERQKLPPFFISLYATAFAMMCGVLWEFYEFTCDSFGMNLQRYMADGHMLVGRAALMDTMGDLIADFIGAFLFAAVAFVKIKGDDSWMKRFFFHKN